ncbi:hypothetical protein KO361_05335 [Candidatus Woesearchaeota archaeon]|nr:hypothetical protein [Candidatus Woesearchaeota archaeon]
MNAKTDLSGNRVAIYDNNSIIGEMVKNPETGTIYVYLYADNHEMRIGVSGKEKVKYAFTSQKEITY